MRLVDSHAHLDFAEFDPDRAEVINRARQSGVVAVVNAAADLAGSRRALQLASANADIFAAVGIHPHEAADVSDEAWQELETLADHPRTVAVGETGLDFYRDLSPRDAQAGLFRRHLDLAGRKDLPVIVHSRDAQAETVAILEQASAAGPLRGVMHCFSGSAQTARRCIEMGLLISFSGTVTFPNARKVQSVVESVPVEKMLIETDAPYLAPQPRRGKRNEPAFVRFTAAKLAEIKKLSVEDLARVTSLNADNLFGLGLEMPVGNIAYPIRDSLYLNITNRCSNECVFCIRSRTDFVKGHHLRLSREPEYDQVLRALELQGLERYREVVFCGYGEPTERLDLLKRIAAELKRRGKTVRLVTNGQGDLINGRPVVEELVGLVDRASVSLNTASPEQYRTLCCSRFGEAAYPAVVDFIRRAAAQLPEVEVTAVTAPDVDVEAVRRLADELGVRLRLRQYDEVG